jgi:hypothetical protein
MTPVLATVILDPTTAMIGGAAVALFSAQLIQKNPQAEIGRTAMLGAAWGLWYGITVGWMYFNFPDWMLAYLVDAEKVSLVITYAVFVAILVLHGMLAALGVSALVQRKQYIFAGAVLACVIVTNFVIMGLQFDAYTHVGTYAEYWAHLAKPMPEVPRAQMGMTVAGILAAVPGLSMLGVRFVQGRKAARAAG